MPATIDMNLKDVQKTLLLPLWGRAIESQKKTPLLFDTAAVDIIGKINYDFSTITNNINPLTQLAWIARALHTDRTVRRFLGTHPKASIVNIGCGLDTTFERVDNGSLCWYDLDLPDVIEFRRKFIEETSRRKMIAGSCLDESWFGEVAKTDGVLFIAGGVLYYFDESAVHALVSRLANAFPGAEIFFDAASPLGVKVANQIVIRAGGMDENAILRWGLKNVRQLEKWDNGIKIVESYPTFRGMRKGLPFKARLITLESDLLKIMFMVHLIFNPIKK